MVYIVETRKFYGQDSYAVGHKMKVPPEELYVEKIGFSIIYDILDSYEQAKTYCQFLVDNNIVTNAFLFHDEGEDSN